MSKITCEIVTLTPKDSAAILEKQKISELKNRFVTQSRVDQYASQMKADKWELNGEPIILDQDDQLLDGQHRLWACITADVSFKTLLVRGVDRKVFPTLDTGKARTGADVLSMAGLTNVSILSATLGWIYIYDQKKLLWKASKSGFTHAIQFAVLDKHPDVMASVLWANNARRNHVLRALAPAPMAFLHYAFAKYDKDRCDLFFKRVGEEEADALDSVTRMLRKYLINCLRVGRPAAQEIMAVCVKAWSAFVHNKPLKALTWRRFGTAREDFPVFPGDTESRGVAAHKMTTFTVEDSIRFITDRLSNGPVPVRQLKAEAKAKGIPLWQIEGSASMKKALGVVSKRMSTGAVWMLKVAD